MDNLAPGATLPAGQFLKYMGECGMWVIENPLHTRAAAQEAAPAQPEPITSDGPPYWIAREGYVHWVGRDGTHHEITLDYATRIAKWMFDTYGDVPQVDDILNRQEAAPAQPEFDHEEGSKP